MKTHLNPQAEAVAKALSPDEIADIDRAIRAMSIEQRLRIARIFHNRCLVRQGGMQLPPPGQRCPTSSWNARSSSASRRCRPTGW